MAPQSSKPNGGEPLSVLEMPFSGAGKALSRWGVRFPIQQLTCLSDRSRGVLHVRSEGGLAVDHRRPAQMRFKGVNHVIDRNRGVTAAEVDDFVAEGFECRKRAAGDVVNEGEVAGGRSIAEKGEPLSTPDPLGEAERGHVGAARWAIDGEVADDRDVDSVEVMPNVGQGLGSKLGGGVRGNRAGNVAGLDERHRLPRVERGG